MKYFANLPLKWKLAAIVCIPVICMLVLAQKEVGRNSYAKHENQNVLALSRYAVHASALVHELQKERGATAGFLGSKGSRFNQELTSQRQDTNIKTKAIQQFLNNFSPDSYGTEFADKVKKALSMLAQLEERRDKVSVLAISKAEAIGYFTKMNAAFLDTITFLAKASSDTDLSNLAGSYVNFLQSKERAGIERAVMAGTFAQNYFDPGVYDKFKSLMTIQDTYLTVFKSLATADQLSFFDSTMRGEPIEKTESMRATAIEHAATGNFGVDSVFWFKMQTAKINLLKKVEDKLSVDLETLAKKLSEKANSELIFSVVLMVAALLITVGFVYFVQQVITRPISSAVSAANAIANGKFDNDIDVSSHDESGQLLNALAAMQKKLYDNQTEMQSQMERERLQAAENSRIRQALENVSANVILADEDGNIIYLNHAAENMFRESAKEIKKTISIFSVDKIVGSSINTFYKQGESNLQGLASVEAVELSLGNKLFNTVANPVNDASGNRLGTVVEWMDLTEQRNAEQEVKQVISSAVLGQLDSRLDAQRFDGFMKTLAESVNELLDTIIAPLSMAADCMENIAAGNIPELITENYYGDFNKIKNNLNTCIESINRLVDDASLLADEAVKGKLDTRVDSSRHKGDFSKIISGVNETLDAVVDPLNVAANYIDRIADGDIPEPITEQYHGSFNQIKDNLNTCIHSINLMIQDAEKLANAAVEGQLEVRADETSHKGDFRTIISGVNAALDAMVNPINECKLTMESLAKGNLTAQMKGSYRGEFDTLRQAVNSSIDNLLKLVEKVLASSSSVDLSSSEIASGINDLSRRTEAQASSLEQTASSMEQMTSTVINTADKAEIVNGLAQEAQEKAVGGGNVVDQAIKSMTDISHASDKITEIISVIDEIAFQTNLLALNAAVEAARAGEQGRGFAVVAGEVRNLAQRSAQAAGEIKSLIQDSSDKVKIGSNLVDESGKTLEDIVNSVKKVCQMITEISEGSVEQRSGITQVNQAVSNMDSMTQQNAALVEQASAASMSLSNEASMVKKMLSTFKI